MRDYFLLQRSPCRRPWPTTTRIRGRNRTGFLDALSSRPRGSTSSKRRSPDCQLQRQDSQVGGYLSFSAPIPLRMLLTFTNSIRDLLTQAPVEGPSSDRKSVV